MGQAIPSVQTLKRLADHLHLDKDARLLLYDLAAATKPIINARSRLSFSLYMLRFWWSNLLNE